MCGELRGLVSRARFRARFTNGMGDLALFFRLGVAAGRGRRFVPKRLLDFRLGYPAINTPLAKAVAKIMDPNAHPGFLARCDSNPAQSLVACRGRN